MRLTKVLPGICCLLALLYTFNLAFGQENPGRSLFLIWDERGKYGFIDSSGRVVVPLSYYAVSPISDGVVAVTIRDGEVRLCGYIDHAGQFVIGPQNKFVCRDFKEGFALVGVYSEQWHETLDGYINKQGEQALGGPFVRADPFSEGLARVTAYETSVFINSQAETVINLKGYAGNDGFGDEYVPAGSFSEGLAEVGIKSPFRYGYYRYGYMNRSGRYVWIQPYGKNVTPPVWWMDNYR